MPSEHPAPVDESYTSALGVAVFAFAGLEWNAIQCCERIEPGSIDALNDRTAGRVADTLRHLVRELPPSEARARLEPAAIEFQALVRSRNNLLHAKPGLNAAGEQRLFRDGDQWTLEELHGIARAFAACARRLADFLALEPL